PSSGLLLFASPRVELCLTFFFRFFSSARGLLLGLSRGLILCLLSVLARSPRRLLLGRPTRCFVLLSFGCLLRLTGAVRLCLALLFRPTRRAVVYGNRDRWFVVGAGNEIGAPRMELEPAHE